MENPLVTTLFVTALGMAVVFAAMGLILGSMVLLTRLAGDRPKPPPEDGNDLESSPESGRAPAPGRQARYQVAAIAVALARARGGRELEEVEAEPLITPWGDYYRRRQLRPSGRGRIA
jgi:Na+-transporting methylmalonyl-CoA/oxaloacetate decarboxylase gamma subunit